MNEPEHFLHPSPWEYVHHSPLYPDQMGSLRFFNGTTAPFPIHISLDQIPFAAATLPTLATAYMPVEPGNRKGLLQNGSEPSVRLLEQPVSISQGSFSTAVLSDSSAAGLCLFQLTDMSSQEHTAQSCIRIFNGAMEGQPLTVAQCAGPLLWEQVPFGSASSYRFAEPGAVRFYTLSSSDREPLSSLSLLIRPGRNYTIYLMGNTWLPEGLRMIPVPDGIFQQQAPDAGHSLQKQAD